MAEASAALPVIVVRPEPGAAATVRRALAAGLDARAFPLFAVRPLDWDPPSRADIDALLIGSANALRHGGMAIELYRGLPAYAVGEATARAARAAGLEIAETGSGGLQDVLAHVGPRHRRLLRLAGRERVPLEVPAGLSVILREVYASEPLAMPAALRDLLAASALILLHSGTAAAHFAELCDRNGIDRSRLRLAAIGPRVAQQAGTGWAAQRSAGTPGDSALLALAQDMCQEARTRS